MASGAGSHSRQSSNATNPAPTDRAKQQGLVNDTPRDRQVRYNVIVRLPFARDGFEDPPQADWTLDKDRKLWKLITDGPAIVNLDWSHVAAEFGVTLPFILQQAAWLYQRHMDNVRDQMRKVEAITTTSPVPGTQPSATSSQAKRLSTGAVTATSRAPSSLSIRHKEIARPVDNSAVDAIRPPGPSRTPSTNTITQSRVNRNSLPPSPRQPNSSFLKSLGDRNSGPIKRLDTLVSESDGPRDASPSPPASSASSSSSESEGFTRQSRILRKPPGRMSSRRKPALSALDDDDEPSSSEDSPMFSTIANTGANLASKGKMREGAEDPGATLREVHQASTSAVAPSPKSHRTGQRALDMNDEVDTSSPTSSPSIVEQGRIASREVKGRKQIVHPLSSSASSNSSTAPPARGDQPRVPDALSPRHRAELARLHLSHGGRKTGAKDGQGSDGTPSMGSSFSDLDDTSITQSALEEALASNFRHGGGSRLSTFGNAFRSRYMQ